MILNTSIFFAGWFWSGSGVRIHATNETAPGWRKNPWSNTGQPATICHDIQSIFAFLFCILYMMHQKFFCTSTFVLKSIHGTCVDRKSNHVISIWFDEKHHSKWFLLLLQNLVSERKVHWRLLAHTIGTDWYGSDRKEDIGKGDVRRGKEMVDQMSRAGFQAQIRCRTYTNVSQRSNSTHYSGPNVLLRKKNERKIDLKFYN